MTTPSPDTSGVRVFPPLIYAGLFSVGYTAHRLAPMHLFVDLPAALRLGCWGLVALALLLAASPALAVVRAGTPPNPPPPPPLPLLPLPSRLTPTPLSLS